MSYKTNKKAVSLRLSQLTAQKAHFTPPKSLQKTQRNCHLVDFLQIIFLTREKYFPS